MNGTERPTKEALLDALEEQAAADEAERIRALSDEALDLELSRDGLDPAAERSRGRHLGAGAASRRAPSTSTARWAALLAAALGAFALVAAFGADRRGLHGASETGPDVARSAPSARPPLPPSPSPSPPSPRERAASLRAEALRACAAGSFDPCADLLDEARALDPAGERGPEVVRARRAILEAVMAGERKTAPR